ncbi:hypothetical protein BaRGS_00012543 [Batillaria attramentaria]|uniref:Secreted protein n=1 Tax=Batillaria attramentaria TaxID=370345 RepID=A0ABD0L9V0_9CAEN
MTACSLAVFCNVQRFLCSATPWGNCDNSKGGSTADPGHGASYLEEPQLSDVLIPRGDDLRRTGGYFSQSVAISP